MLSDTTFGKKKSANLNDASHKASPVFAPRGKGRKKTHDVRDKRLSLTTDHLKHLQMGSLHSRSRMCLILYARAERGSVFFFFKPFHQFHQY